jgi:hypothetical protein
MRVHACILRSHVKTDAVRTIIQAWFASGQERVSGSRQATNRIIIIIMLPKQAIASTNRMRGGMQCKVSAAVLTAIL